ncbi:MAG: ATP-binding protein [Chloroflexota bacterium]
MTSAHTDRSAQDDLDWLLQAAALLQPPLEADNFQAVSTLLTQATGAAQAWLICLQGEHESTCATQHVFSEADPLPFHDGPLWQIITGRQALMIADVNDLSDWHALQPVTAENRALLCVPGIHEGQAAVLIVLGHPQCDYFTTRHLKLTSIIAERMAVTINSAHLIGAVRSQQRQLEAVIQAFPDMLLVMDDVGRILYANNGMRPLLGDRHNETIIGERLTDIPDRDAALDTICEILIETLDNPLEAGTHLAFEVSSAARGKDFQVTMSTWRNPSKSIAGYILVLHDISRLRDLHRFKDEMLRIASHDLRTPVALINGYANMIALDTPDADSPVHEHVESVLHATRRMERLLNDLLHIERVRANPLDLQRTVQPARLIREIVDELEPEAARKNLKFGAQLNLDFAGVVIHGDPVLIRQAVENLIGNAIKYTPPGGCVAVTARMDFETGRFHFTVADTGIGIPTEKLPYVFESFYRVDSVAVQEIKGSGLGLSLVKNIIERHHGEVWANSEENRGSRFGFWLPLVEHSQSDNGASTLND